MAIEDVIPSPRHLGPAPRMRWGVIGAGYIAGRFVDALRRHSTQEVVAVGSQAAERAAAFAEQHALVGTAGSVEQVLDLAEVEVIYIATPHNSHRDLAERALDAGKHVVIEKPLATTETDALAITTRARDRGLLAMEAMWTRYLPQADVLRQLLDGDVIGEVTHVSADFGFVAAYSPRHRLFDPALGGGALLDAGVYPVSFIASVLGPPTDVIASGTLAETGVDDHAQLTLPYGRAIGAAATSLRSALPVRAVIAGTGGRIEIEPPFIRPSSLTLSTKAMWGPDPDASRWTDDALADPYDALHYEADAAARFIAEGRTESPLHAHAETVAIISALERARQQLGAR